MSIAITGATGQLGQLVLTQLLQYIDANNIVALVRQPEKAQGLSTQGIDVRAFDYTQDSETLAKQLHGVEKLLLISSSEVGQRATQHKNVIDAARLANVKHIVYTSILKADQSPLALAEEHVITEKLIQDTGLTYTLLRNGWYSENYTGSLKQAIEHGAILGATQHGKISSASRLDYATAAAIVLSGSEHDNKVYELAGDESYTLDDVAKLVNEVSQTNITYQDLPEAEYKKVLVQTGLPDAFAGILADSDAGVAKDALFSDSKDLHQLINRSTTSIKQTIEDALA